MTLDARDTQAGECARANANSLAHRLEMDGCRRRLLDFFWRTVPRIEIKSPGINLRGFNYSKVQACGGEILRLTDIN